MVTRVAKASAAAAPAATPFDHDIAIVGAGPVGLTIANTLGLYGVKVLLIEKLDRIIDYPRAIGIDDEALRTLPIVASIRSDNVDGFVRLLEATSGVRAEHRGGEIILRQAR